MLPGHMSLLTGDGHSSVDSDDDWSLVSSSPTHKSPMRESPMSSDRTPGSKSPDSADGSVLLSLYAVDGHDSEDERGPTGLGPGMGSQLINMVASRSKKEKHAALAETLGSDDIPMESEHELNHETHQELKNQTQAGCHQEVQHQVKHAPQPEFEQEMQDKTQEECHPEHPDLQRPPLQTSEQEMEGKTQQECQQEPQHEQTQQDIKQELLQENQHQYQQTFQNPLAVEPTPGNEFWPIWNSTVEAAKLLEGQPCKGKQLPRRSPVKTKHLRNLKPQRFQRCSKHPIGMLRAAASKTGTDQGCDGDSGQEQVNADANIFAHAKPGIKVNGGNELMPSSARYIGVDATAKAAQEAVETVPLLIHKDVLAKGAPILAAFDYSLRHAVQDVLAEGAPVLVAFDDLPRSTVQERALHSASVANTQEEAPHICGLYNPTMFQPPGLRHRRRPATSAPHGSRLASSASHGSRPASSGPQGGLLATSASHGGSLATSAFHGSRPATSAFHGSRPATSVPHGGRLATSASHGGLPATSAPHGSRPASSAPHGSPPASSAPHGSPPASSAPHGSPPANSAPHGSPPASSAPHVSRPATSAPLGSRPATSAPHSGRPATSASHGGRSATSCPLVSRPATSVPHGSRPATSASQQAHNRRSGCKHSSSRTAENIIDAIICILLVSVFLFCFGAIIWIICDPASPTTKATSSLSIGDLPGGYVAVPAAALHTMKALLDMKATKASIEPAVAASLRDILNISYPVADGHVPRRLQDFPGFDMEEATRYCQNQTRTWKFSECQWAVITSWINSTAVDLAKHNSDDKLGSLNINMQGSDQQIAEMSEHRVERMPDQDHPATSQDTEAGSKDQAASYGERFFRIALIALGFM